MDYEKIQIKQEKGEKVNKTGKTHRNKIMGFRSQLHQNHIYQ